LQPALAALLGVLSFAVVVGPNILDTANIAWMSSGDLAQHYLGWSFFRNAPWLVPPGANPDFGLEIGSSIFFADIIPLFGLTFKALGAPATGPFQYHGLWVLLCFALQGTFGFLLVSEVTSDARLRLIGTGFFLFTPAFLWRLHGHFSLVGHWLILAALWLSVSAPGRRQRAWPLLTALAALVHSYFLVMVLALWAADLARRLWLRRSGVAGTAVEALLVLGASVACLWLSGFFMVRDGLAAGGFGFYRMDLLSPIDSSSWSYVLPDIPEGAGAYEGFNFLGLGTLLLLASAVAARRLPRIPVALLPLTLVVCGLGLFALSNHIGLPGSWEMVIPLPAVIESGAGVLRSSGRMFWPVSYVIVLGAMLLVVRRFGPRRAGWCLGVCLALQVADTSAGWLPIRERLQIEGSDWQTPMAAEFWQQAAARYPNVRMLPVGNARPQWKVVAAYAVTHGNATDSVYLARMSAGALERAQRAATEALETGRYAVDSLYLLSEVAARTAILTTDRSNDLLAYVDGFFVLAPGWNRCTDCTATAPEAEFRRLFAASAFPAVHAFSAGGTGGATLGRGWSQPEPDFTWTDGDAAEIAMLLPAKLPQRFDLVIHATAFVDADHPMQRVQVRINGHPAAWLSFDTTSREGWHRIPVERRWLRETDGRPLLHLRFELAEAAQAAAVARGHDPRRLGIAHIELREAPQPLR
jgi:hypothetical protein